MKKQNKDPSYLQYMLLFDDVMLGKKSSQLKTLQPL